MFLNIIDIITHNKLLITIVTIVLLFLILFVLWAVQGWKGKIKANRIACIGIFTALSIVLYFLKFNLPFLFPSFLEINFSLLPIIIIGYMLGPVEAITIVFLRAIIKLPFTSTFCVGEFADLLIGVPVALVTSLIYRSHHSKRGAIISLLFGILTWVLSGVLTNYFINIPFFLNLYFNGDISSFVGILSIIPGVNETNYMMKYILFAAIPFNLLLSSIVSIVTFLVYKKISILFNKFNKKEVEEVKYE